MRDERYGFPLAWLLVLAAMAVAAWLRYSFVPPHHAMYIDEPWYAEAACSLSRTQSLTLCEETWSGTVCEPFRKAVGWPILLSVWTSLVGCSSTAAIEISRALGTASTGLVALAAVFAGAPIWQGAVGTFLLATHPVHVEWSATGETNVAAAFAMLLGTVGALLFVARGRWGGLGLAAMAMALATAIRPESLVSVAVMAMIAAGGSTGTSFRRRLFVLSAVAIPSGIAAIAGMPLWRMNESISDGGFLAFSNIGHSLATLTLRVDGVVALLGVIGASALPRRQASLLLGGVVAGAVVVLAYDRFSTRMLLTPVVVLMPACGAALGVVSQRAWRAIATVATIVIVVALWRVPCFRPRFLQRRKSWRRGSLGASDASSQKAPTVPTPCSWRSNHRFWRQRASVR